jgi:HEAT repeat protein
VIASAGADGVVRLFEALTGREVRRLPGHDGLVTSLAFTKDGARLVSSGEDTTVLVWNVDPQPGAEEPGDAWDALGGDDARRAWRVMWRLVATGDRGVALLAAKLAEVPEIPEKTRRLIAELEDEDVGTRERATEELKKLGPDAEPALRRAAEHAPPGESRARLVALLDPMEQEPVACAAVLRRARSIAALERIGTAEARALLARLAEGASTLQARTAKAALERLKARK